MARGPKKTLLQATTLAQLADGYVGRIVDAELEAIQKDLDDRGADGKPRTLTIKLSLVPEGNGVVDIRANVTKKLPDHRPPKTMAKLDQRSGALVFNPDCAENPDQMTVHDLDHADAE